MRTKDMRGVFPEDRVWVEIDGDAIPTPPPWSCYCLNSFSLFEDPDLRDRLFAQEGCENCLGYGFMPVPPSELYK